MKKMSEGNIYIHLITYALPLLLGNLFQLAYNSVDSIIIGKAAGESALAAVGVGNPVMNIRILGISGIGIGAGVIMSEYYGESNEEMLRKELGTTLTFGMIFICSIALIGAIATPMIFYLLQVPGAIIERATVYLRIIFIMIPFTFLYTIFSSACRSMGDSKTPVIFLAISSCINAALDIFFIYQLHLDVVGAACATVIAEISASSMCIVYVNKRIPILRLQKDEYRINFELLRRTISYGSITALQQSCVPLGKLACQSVINSMGVSAIATFNAVSRVDDFALIPEQSIANAMTTFTAQNKGAMKIERIKEGFKKGILLEMIFFVFIAILIGSNKVTIMGLFSNEAESELLTLGIIYLSKMVFFYWFPALTNGIQGYFRGMGQMKVTLLSTIINMGCRVIAVIYLVPKVGFVGIVYGSLIGWICMLAFEIPYYLYFQKRMI